MRQRSIEPLFAEVDRYDQMLHRGLTLTGESREYFAAGRLSFLRENLQSDLRVARILDFGCGSGSTTHMLARTFPGSLVVGVDAVSEVVDLASERRRRFDIRFAHADRADRWAPYDLIYVNGVFHHIPSRGRRVETARCLGDWLSPGGVLAVFENNPLNPGTRIVMSRIAFDRSATPLMPGSSRAFLREAGFRRLSPTYYLFFFPRLLRMLRVFERGLRRLPAGGQYCVLAGSAAPVPFPRANRRLTEPTSTGSGE